MMKVYGFSFAALSLLMLQACEKSTAGDATQQQVPLLQEVPKKTLQEGAESKPSNKGESSSLLSKLEFKTIEWPELMPKDDLEALLNPPDYLDDVEDGSIEDQISNQVQNALLAANDDRYQQALSSTRIIAEMDGQAIRIPGYIVPLEYDDKQAITQFFLVPFFGACLHLPPPPPNQIIFVESDKGLQIDALYEPFWISGVLKASLVDNDTATSA